MALRQTLKDWCVENKRLDLLDEWDYELNTVSPDSVGCKSSKYKVQWICPEGHSYDAYITNRTRRGDGCPYCSGHRLLKGFNDLETSVPSLCSEWDKGKNRKKHDEDVNNGIPHPHPAEPSEISWGSSIKVYWKCKEGHESFLSPSGRKANKNDTFTMCNKCAARVRARNRRKTFATKNNLAENIPQAADEWVRSEHGLSPYEVSCHSLEMVHWRCSKGHEFDKRVTDRVYTKNGRYFLHECAECTKYLRTSIPEQIIYYYVKQVFPDAINPYNDLGVELDIYIPSIRAAIEFDGSYTHKNKLERDNLKDDICSSNHISLFRFRPHSLPNTKSANRIVVEESSTGIVQGLLGFFEIIKVNPPHMDVDADYNNILELFQKRKGLKVSETYLLDEWDFENNTISPNNISARNTKKLVYWLCPECHKSYQSYPYNRFVRKTGCRDCSNKNAVRCNARKVRNIETGEVFNSISEAEQAYGKKGNTSISNCCRGRYETAYGYHWAYDNLLDPQ